MPYIKEEDYVRAEEKPAVPGELNFALTVRAIHYFMGNIEAAQFKEQARHLVTHYMERVGVSYTNYNAVVGVLMCCGWEALPMRSPSSSVRMGAAPSCEGFHL